MKTIQYNLCSAYEAGVKLHPQQDVEQLGMKILTWEPCEMADSVFMEVDVLPANLPNYIVEATALPSDWPSTPVSTTPGKVSDWANVELHLGNKKIEGITPLVYNV